jgi:galactose mutarotase-like enzyme
LNITIKNNLLTAVINQRGAELTSLKKDDHDYIWEGNPEFWAKHSPILFPIVGTLKNNSYTYKGNTYQMTRHGFARDNEFTVKNQTDNSVIFSLASTENTLNMYPFEFELELKYTLVNTILAFDYTVINKGIETMPFSIGAHPAFALPGNFSDYSLIFEKDETLVNTQLEKDLVSDKTISLPTDKGKLALSHSLFDNDALILKSTVSNYIDIAKNNNRLLRVAYNDFPDLGIWTKENAPFLCIEPWQGYSDSLASNGNILEKEGIILLKPGEKFNAGFSIEIFR